MLPILFIFWLSLCKHRKRNTRMLLFGLFNIFMDTLDRVYLTLSWLSFSFDGLFWFWLDKLPNHMTLCYWLLKFLRRFSDLLKDEKPTSCFVLFSTVVEYCEFCANWNGFINCFVTFMSSPWTIRVFYIVIVKLLFIKVPILFFMNGPNLSILSPFCVRNKVTN